MAIKRSSADPDRIISAWIHGTASRHTARGEPTGDARTAAINELRDVASQDGTMRKHGPIGKPRADLLSQEAGLLTGLADASDGLEVQRDQRRRMAALCREAAGDELDEAIVAEWIEVGKERANPPGPGLGRLYSS